MEVPADGLMDKILFIVNNVSFDNMESKVKELKALLKEVFYRWFGHYLVVKRVSIEPNFHSLYLSFLDLLETKDIDKAVLGETYASIRILLASEKTATSSQERTLLKNLGSWLGAMTLAKDKPIKYKDLALKELLIEGYQMNRLIVTIPFVCKVLEQCKNSMVFHPPNPWLMAILRLLVELYQYADLKLNLKFEIEVMCRNMDVELKDIEPAGLLFADRVYAQFGGHDGMGGPAVGGGGYPGQANDEMVRQHQQQQQSGPVINAATAPAIVIDEQGGIAIPNLASYVSFNGNLPLFNGHPALKKLVLVAIDRSIKEIIGPVVERSVSIAVVAARELILKDFSSEPNEEFMRRAAHLMVQNLAGNLAMVTSKDPFSKCLTQNLRMALQQQGVGEPVIEMIVAAIIPENVDLGSAIIEKVAMEKSIAEVEEALAHAFLARRRQRDRGMPWIEVPQYGSSRFVQLLPEALRLRPGAPHQQRIYEDFARPGTSVLPNAGPVRALSPGQQQNLSAMDDQAPVNPLQQIMEKISALLDELDIIVKQNADVSLSTLPANHEIITLVRQINVAASQFFVRDELAMWFAQKLVQLLFKTEVTLGIEIYIILLERICELSKRVAREFTTWLFFSDDERKLNVTVSVSLIQAGLLNVLELDTLLAKQMEQQTSNTTMIEYAVKLIHKCIVGQSPVVTYTELYYSLDMISRLASTDRLPKSVAPLVQDLKSKAPGLFNLPSDEMVKLKEQHVLLFEEWTHLYQRCDTNHATILEKFGQAHILSDENAMALFVRHATEVASDSFLRLKNLPGGTTLSYQSLDALASLLIVFVDMSRFAAPSEDEKKVLALSKILGTIVLLIVHSHEIRRDTFDPRPYFRLLTSLIVEFDSHQATFDKINVDILKAICNTLHALRPAFVPGFVFAWLELVSHRKLMPKLLHWSDRQGWPMFHRLLLDIFQFLSPFLRHAEMTDPIRVLYKGTLRVLLLLLHDFPEFLCDYHFSFCDVIPPSCIQLRNLILSAFPRDMLLPDPFTPNLKVDLLPEISQAPKVMSDFSGTLSEAGLLAPLDNYLKTRTPASFLADARTKLLLAPQDVYISGTNYNVPLINAVVLFV